MAKSFSLFPRQDESSSRMMKNLLAANEPILQAQQYPEAGPVEAKIPKRPQSANAAKRKPRSASNGKASKPVVQVVAKEKINQLSAEDLASELYEVKKKALALEETISFLKGENQRLESEATKQQRRIDQLMNLSEGVKSGNNSQSLRKEIEKSILVRQLKNQLTIMKNVIAEKDSEIDSLKRDIRSSHLKEVECERDEYFSEVQRLLKVVEDLKEDLSKERQRREWNSKMAGETGDDLRKELQRLATGYQTILASLSNKAASRPSTAGSRAADKTRPMPESDKPKRPQSAASHRSNQQTQPTDNLRPVSLANALGNNHTNAPDSMDFLENFKPDAFLASNQSPYNAEPYEDNYEQNDWNDVDSGKNSRVGSQAAITPSLVPPNVRESWAVPVQQPLPVASTLPAHQNPSSPNSVKSARSSSGFRVGEKIQALYANGTTWFDGVIRAVHHDGNFEIGYNDGGYEKSVAPSLIRKPGAPATAVVAPSSPAKSIPEAKFKVGQQVDALYYNGTTWYKGEIKSASYLDAKNSHVYDITYEDGDREKQVIEANIKAIEAAAKPVAKKPEPAPSSSSAASPQKAAASPQKVVVEPTVESKFKVNDKVEGLFAGETWYPAKVATVKVVSGAVKYSLLYDDGDQENGLDEARLRSPAGSKPVELIIQTPPTPAIVAQSQIAAGKFKVDDKVEAFFQEYDAWYAGKIAKNNGDGTYVITYDDGDVESKVSADRIRLFDVKPTPRDGFKKDDKVKARFNAGNAWFPAVVEAVATVGGKRTYSLLYEDGDRETNVAEDLIVLVEEAKKEPSSPVRNSNKFKEGDKVEANYEGSGNWFPCSIKKVKGGGVYDVSYDDGDSENDVKEVLIRLREEKKAPAVSPAPTPAVAPTPAPAAASAQVVVPVAAPAASNKFKEGDKVEANYESSGNWFPGSIRKIKSVGIYDILYDDGDSENDVKESLIRLREVKKASVVESTPAPALVPAATVSSSKFKEGDKVEANYEGSGNWFPGSIRKVKGSGVYDILYDDGDSENDVKEALVRLREAAAPVIAPAPAPAAVSTPVASSKFKEGDKVEANYEGSGNWFPGSIKKVKGGGVYDILYDDGDSENDVKEVLIRSPVVEELFLGKFNKGDKVEGDYRGKGKWYGGKIAKVHSSSYDVVYDDGEEEHNVSESKIRQHPDAAIPVVVHKPTTVTTASSSNLDSFLNDLSDDDDDMGFGLDAGRPVEALTEDAALADDPGADDYDEDFAA